MRESDDDVMHLVAGDQIKVQGCAEVAHTVTILDDYILESPQATAVVSARL